MKFQHTNALTNKSIFYKYVNIVPPPNKSRPNKIIWYKVYKSMKWWFRENRNIVSKQHFYSDIHEGVAVAETDFDTVRSIDNNVVE